MNLPACCKLFGGEGKAETIYVEQMVSSLFAHKDQNLFQAIGCIGINPYRASKRELDLALLNDGIQLVVRFTRLLRERSSINSVKTYTTLG